jgi:flavin-dependent dehydrogenase
MVYNGWIWIIPLKKDLVSIGVVITLDEYKKAQSSPQEFLENYIRNMPLTKNGISKDAKLEGKVRLYGNLGYTTTRAFGGSVQNLSHI